MENCWKWKWGCGLHYNVKPYDFLILEVMCWFCRRMHPFWIKHIEHFRWCGKLVLFTITRNFLYILKYWKVNYFFKTTMSIPQKKIRSDKQAWNFLIEAKTYPDQVQGKLWCCPCRSSHGITKHCGKSISNHMLGPLDDLLQKKQILQIKFST